MRFVLERFSKSTHPEYQRYRYEAVSNKTTYDVDVRIDDGKRLYRMNGEPTERKPLHKSIEKHFNI